VRLEGWAEGSKASGSNLVPEDEGDGPSERLFESLSVEGVQLDLRGLEMLLIRRLLGE